MFGLYSDIFYKPRPIHGEPFVTIFKIGKKKLIDEVTKD